LLTELKEVATRPGAATATEVPGVADTIYRRYFLGAIVLTLTAGATWGALLLWKVALSGTFAAASIYQVNAHGEAQIFGWVGLFIMGFAYQAFPRLWQTSLVAPRLAAGNFTLMVVGLVLRTVGMATPEAGSLALSLALTGGLLQVVAVAAFAGQIAITFARSDARFDTSVGFILSALAWFLVSSLFGLWHTWSTMAARTVAELIGIVATYQLPLRDLQIHGLALFMILGVALRLFPPLFNLPRVDSGRAWWAWGLLTGAVLGEVILFLFYRWTGNRVYAASLLIPRVMLLAGVWLVVRTWRPWRAFPTRDRSAKFVRAALIWLVVSVAMLLLQPVYARLSGMPFSHAYSGATRHAITVGFITLMIMGMAAKVVPTLGGIDPRTLPGLWGPFLFVNTGCLLRVVTQILADWNPASFAVIGVSGTLEVAGLGWWGFGLARIILRRGDEGPTVTREAGERPTRIEPQHIVADVLDLFPETLAVFERHGFTPLRQPLLRRTLARQITVVQTAHLKGVREELLLHDLNAAVATRRLSLCDSGSTPPSGALP
jgi:hypothetical protein